MEHKILFVISILFLSFQANSQYIEWDDWYDFNFASEKSIDIQLNENGNIISLLRGNDIIVTKTKSSGGLELSFGDNGAMYYSTNYRPNNFVQDKDGNIIISFRSCCLFATVKRSGIIKINQDGIPIEDFGNGGLYHISDSVPYDALASFKMILNSKDELTFWGYYKETENDSLQKPILYRTDLNGVFKNDFGEEGKVFVEGSTLDAELNLDMIYDNDDRILISQWFLNSNTNETEFRVLRYNDNGTIDQDFGNGGMTILSSLPQTANLTAIDMFDDGSILLAFNQILVKLLDDGSFDPNFGDQGFFYVNPSASPSANDMIITKEQKILMVGEVSVADGDMFFSRFLADGTQDSMYGNNGVFKQNYTAARCYMNKVVEGNESIYCLGEYSTEPNGGFTQALYMKLFNPCDSTMVAYVDMDGDGFGEGSPQEICSGPLPVNYSFNNLDCYDFDSATYPGAPEVCNGVDDDCNGQIDEGFDFMTFYEDLDEDGFGTETITVEGCTAPWGFTSVLGDCNDYDPNINPDSAEICNQEDDNCNGTVDEGLDLITYYEDLDGDGFGNENISIQECNTPPGFTILLGDCDDTNPNVNPESPEICNQLDDNCNGAIDEDLELFTYYEDLDGDGYGNESITMEDCNTPTGFTILLGDCDDNNADINPEAEEILNNGIDENCDGVDPITALNEFNNQINIDIFPNPASNEINFKSTDNDIDEIKIFNLLGTQLFFSQPIGNTETVDISSYRNGIYLLVINNNITKYIIVEN